MFSGIVAAVGHVLLGLPWELAVLLAAVLALVEVTT